MRLLRHGDYVNPECQPLPDGDGSGAFGRSTPEDRPETSGRGIIKRFRKNESVGSRPISFGWIKATYPNAIEYTGITSEARGLLFMWGVFSLLLMGGFGVWVWPVPLTAEEPALYGVFMALACWLFVLFMLLFTNRIELFRPTDEPVVFDRQHRKVYRIFREQAPGWKGLLKPWPLYAVAYDWDLVDAEHNAEISASGTVITQQNALTFFVRKSATDPTIIDFFNVGQIMALTEQSVPAVWEHIRRFMEDNGPHLPPGEAVYAPQPPQNLWRAIRGVMPMGPMPIGQWVASHPFFALVFLALSPLFGPLFLIAGIGNWLSHKTAIPIRWPQEVLDAIGPATAGESSGGEINH